MKLSEKMREGIKKTNPTTGVLTKCTGFNYKNDLYVKPVKG